MLSTPTLHPFFSHFPPALFLAGLVMLGLARRRPDSRWVRGACMNFSMGLLMAVLAILTGMFAADLSQWPIVEVEGHQGYSFLTVTAYIFCTIYVYTQPFKPAALFYYGLAILSVGATAWSGYQLVFH
jgi:MYXO-CTERM domain-containing protein